MQLTARSISSFILWSIATVSGHAQGSIDYHPLEIPEVAKTQPQAITTRDLVLLRDIDTFSVSPDGKFVAINVRQAVIESNNYRTAWFVAPTSASARAINVGEAGEPQMLFSADNRTSGEFQSSPSQWSPDSMWIAYLVKKNGGFQVWRSRRDGSVQEQISHNPANVRDFMWS